MLGVILDSTKENFGIRRRKYCVIKLRKGVFMGKKIKEHDSLDLLKEQYNYLIFRTWLSVIITCFFFIMGIIGLNSGFDKNEKIMAVSFCFWRD